MNKKQIRLTESDLKQIVKESVNRIVKESDELDANDWKARYLRDAHYPIDMKDIENKASWETFDDNVNSLYGQRGCYNDDYASQAYADDPFSDFYGLENKNTYDLKGYLAKRKLNKLAKNESKNMNKKLIRLTESDLHKIVKESVNRIIKENKRRLVREWDNNEQFEDEDDFEWRIDDICAEFGNGEVLINGVLGLWDGKKRIQPTPCSDIRSAIQKCIGRDGEIMSPNDIEFDGETVSLKVCHHDGTNNFEITHYD